MSQIELMVVVGIIGILSAMLLISVAEANGTARRAGCINNQKQLILTWALYSNDHNGELVPNHSHRIRGLRQVPWVTGMGHPHYASMTNLMYLTNDQYAAFAPYLKTPKVYRCPENRERIGGHEAIRSYSMNQFMGAPPQDTNHLYFEEQGDIPEPSRMFVFCDQNQRFICWPMMMIRMKENYWINLPATVHNYGATLAFADGHVEYKKWLEFTTAGKKSVKRWIQAQWPNHGTQARPNDRDLAWLRARSTVEVAP